jgi:AcrR family transcriptional regulator
MTTEEKIIRAARDIFREKGKDGARMQEIADHAGINKALLHYYFRSKDILFDKVFQNEIREVFQQIMSTIADKADFRSFLKAFIKTYLHNIAPRRNVIRFVLWEADEKKDLFIRNLSEVIEEHGFYENPFIARIRNAIENGEIRPCDPVNLVLSILGMSIFPFIAAPVMERIFPGLDLTDAAFIDRRAKEITVLIWDGVKPEV